MNRYILETKELTKKFGRQKAVANLSLGTTYYHIESERIPRAFDGYKIAVTGLTVINHVIEFFTFFCVSAGDAVVGINTGKFPIRIFLNIFCIMFYLSFVAGSLRIAVCTDTTVRCDSEPWFFFFLLTSVVSNLSPCRNQHYISHY